MHMNKTIVGIINLALRHHKRLPSAVLRDTTNNLYPIPNGTDFTRTLVGVTKLHYASSVGNMINNRPSQN